MSHEIPAGNRKPESGPSMRAFKENYPAFVEAVRKTGCSSEEAAAGLRAFLKEFQLNLKGGA